MQAAAGFRFLTSVTSQMENCVAVAKTTHLLQCFKIISFHSLNVMFNNTLQCQNLWKKYILWSISYQNWELNKNIDYPYYMLPFC